MKKWLMLTAAAGAMAFGLPQMAGAAGVSGPGLQSLIYTGDNAALQEAGYRDRRRNWRRGHRANWRRGYRSHRSHRRYRWRRNHRGIYIRIPLF